MKNINQATRGYAHRLLQCLTVAIRPLRLEELAEILAFDFDKTPGGIPQLNADWRREDQEQAVLSTCSSLITVVYDGGSRVVQFSHFSVKEYLTSERLAAAVKNISLHHIALTPAHTILAQACLGVLLQLDDDIRESYVQRFPLVEYAAEHWVDHAHFEAESFRIKDGMENMFDQDKPHLSRWLRVHDIDDYNSHTFDKLTKATPVYYAALCGFSHVVEKLLREHPEHVNAKGGSRGTAFHAASRRNHVNVAQLLLKHGADVNALGWSEQTPLHTASLRGSLEIGQWLLEHGADVNAKDNEQWTPLYAAARLENFEFVRMLLGHHPDINARTDTGHTPMQMAIDRGHIDIARVLLDNGVDPNSRGFQQSTLLHRASYCEKLEVARLLLERGADVNAVDEWGNTAYQIALKRGQDELAQLLLGHAIEKKT